MVEIIYNYHERFLLIATDEKLVAVNVDEKKTDTWNFALYGISNDDAIRLLKNIGADNFVINDYIWSECFGRIKELEEE
jgi:regulation of enolase protein 1 (concanavalin A-like superfamily)